MPINRDIKLVVSIVGICLTFSFVLSPSWGYYESFVAHLLSGSITKTPFIDFYIYGLEPFCYLTAFLHSCIPNAPWFGILYLTGIILSTFIILQSLFVIHEIQTIKLKFLLPFLIILLNVNLIEYSATYLGFMLTASGIIGLWKIFCYENHFKVFKIKPLFFAFLFISGFSLRIESGLGATLMIGSIILLKDGFRPKVFKIGILPVISLTLFSIYFVSKHQKYTYLNEIEPYIFYVTDSKYKPSIQFRNPKDSIIITAIRGSFFMDTPVLTPDYYKYLATNKLAEEAKYTNLPLHVLKIAYQVSKQTIIENYLILLIWLLFILIALTQTNNDLARNIKSSIIAYNLFSLIIITILAYLLKMEKWHFIPLVTMAIFGNLFLGGPFLNESLNTTKHHFLILISYTLLAFISTSKAYKISIRTESEEKETNLIYNQIQEIHPNKLVFLDVDSRLILSKKVFVSFEKVRKINFVLYDLGQLGLLNQYKKILDETCHCNSSNASAFFQFLNKENNNILFIATDYRSQLLSSYAKLVHQVELPFRNTADDSINTSFYLKENSLHFKQLIPKEK